MTARNNTRFFENSSGNNFFVVDNYSAPRGAIFSLEGRGQRSYEEYWNFWGDSITEGFGIVDVPYTAREILPQGTTEKEEKIMRTFKNLKELFTCGEDFQVSVGFNGDKVDRVMEVFRKARNQGLPFEIDEVFEGTWMNPEGGGYTPDNWGHFGVVSGNTFVCDGIVADIVLSVDELEALAEAVTPSVVDLATTGSSLVLEGEVLLTYKNGQTFNLRNNGKASLDVDRHLIITEHDFVKDTQPAYERVEVKLSDLASVEAGNTKLTVVDENIIAVTTTFKL